MIHAIRQFCHSYNEGRPMMDVLGCIAVLAGCLNSVCSKSIGQLHLCRDVQLPECVIRVLVGFALG